MRHWMEDLGWRQGGIVNQQDVQTILSCSNISYSEEIILIVASGSCDVANLNDPCIEFSIAKKIESYNSTFGFNKNPRRLNLKLEVLLSEKEIIFEAVELLGHEKIQIKKTEIPEGIVPDPTRILSAEELRYYVDWLAGRYKRPAFPTTFDRRLDTVWLKKKRLKAADKVNELVLGIYAKVYPETELQEHENYAVNMFVMVKPDLSAEQKLSVQSLINSYKEAFTEANMDLDANIPMITEDKISVQRFKEYQRFNMDELSYKSDGPYPTDI
ncbi:MULTISPECIES: hypothetical protein [Acinetobacter calcoaceticus/baumannii complex]|nr:MULTISPECIES: hypothetical protein [Acinetobacter calcoaceticus/baumannii complex]CAH1079955.1 Uncharacterised protein [Acinetobacter phage MD-2021a]EME5680972.1 hypothetical protein [Acinetobacter baumannii]KAA8932691.1 hypothetical protein DLI68_16050 [Acinetobacter baumannii]KAF0615818.1 hypothetical protein AB71192_03718 [Acinetobacter baumannii]KAF0622508.1 hypothetical protein AB71198_03744 [Acinetobacter baumannii]